MKLNNFKRATFLILTLPLFLGCSVKKFFNKKAFIIICVLLVICTCIIVCFRKCSLQVVDLQTAFNTGNIRPKTDYIVIHHTAGSDDGTINECAKIHYGQHKWSTIAYHYWITRDGTIYKLHDDDEITPHTLSHNSDAVSICMVGNFNDKEPSEQQLKSLKQITSYLQKKYEISAENVVKHSELNATDCCGLRFNIVRFRYYLK